MIALVLISLHWCRFAGADSTGSDSTDADPTGADSTGGRSTGANSTGTDSTGAHSTSDDSTGADSPVCVHSLKISTSWEKIAQIYLPDLPLFASLMVSFVPDVDYERFSHCCGHISEISGTEREKSTWYQKFDHGLSMNPVKIYELKLLRMFRFHFCSKVPFPFPILQIWMICRFMVFGKSFQSELADISASAPERFS